MFKTHDVFVLLCNLLLFDFEMLNFYYKSWHLAPVSVHKCQTFNIFALFSSYESNT